MANLSPLSAASLEYPGSSSLHVTAPPRLSPRTLGLLPRSVARPGFDVAALRPGILHLGCGAFHRAHQAVFTQRALQASNAAEPEPWGIIAASLRKPDMRDALRPQHGLYTVLERGAEGVQAEVIGTVREVLYAPEEHAAMAARFLDPDIHIVTLTVTSAAYCIDATTGRLCAAHPDIQRDLHGATPQSAIGVLVAGLAQVRQAGLRPPVVMSCDNLAGNGRVLRQAAMDYAALRDDSLAEWIGTSVQFPCSMVDRIVPAATEVDQADAAAMLGLHDAAPVSAEPFRQWVIETFEGPRPRWEEAGAEFVPDVAPWEASKLRLLNGTHMAIAYLGALSGFRTVAEFVADPAFGSYALRFMLREQMPTMPPSDHDITAYAHQLLRRWRNPGIVHQLTRVGRNGSEKLQTRLLASLCENRHAGRPAPCTTLAVAAWICCASGRTGQAGPVQMEDPLDQHLKAIGQAAGDDAARLTDLALGVEQAFGTELPNCAAFRADLTQAVRALQRGGARAAVMRLTA
ncbi:mannitol dehydrogenase family protein [Teichococcus aestuarii]|uniref:mannitol dehydrogenase family protein n=1 Tax=Teichococcus aestuarii TaxID=568898 RepID=UPI003612F5A4